MDDFENEIRPHLQPDLRSTVETRILQAAPHYLWFFTDGRKKTGFCSACLESGIRGGAAGLSPYQHVFEALGKERHALGIRASAPHENNFSSALIWNDWRHLHYGVCPLCHAVVQYRSTAMKRSYMNDTVILAHYSRSAADPDTVVMTLWQGWIEWARWDPCNEKLPEVTTRLREVCLMKKGTAGARYVADAVWMADYNSTTDRAENFSIHFPWRRRKECISGFWPVEWRGYRAKSRETGATDIFSIQDTFSGTPVPGVAAKLRNTCEADDYRDQISLYNSLLRYPCLEYLVKMGSVALAADIIDRKARHLVNLRGKTAQAVLRLDGNTLGWIKGTRIALDSPLLSLLQTRNKLGLHLGNDVILRMRQNTPVYDSDFLRGVTRILPRAKWEKALRYAVTRGIWASDYIDHLGLMEKLTMDFSDDSMTMPRDFAELHARLALRLNVQTHAGKDSRIQKRARGTLGAFWFSALGWTLRPMLSAEEIVREGTVLRHCVGDYVDRYADGDTILLCLRPDTALDAPCYTVEYSTRGRRVQVRGYKNGMQKGWRNGVRIEDEETLEQFWHLFDLYRNDWTKAHRAKKQKGSVTA